MDSTQLHHRPRSLTPLAKLTPRGELGTAECRQTTAEPPRLTVGWASTADQVRQAQALRYRVFAGEMGARLDTPPGTPPGLDVDRFDAHCEHLLVQTAATDEAPAQVVGTYRVLTPASARRAGGLYSDQEFELSRLDRLDRLRPRIADDDESGRPAFGLPQALPARLRPRCLHLR